MWEMTAAHRTLPFGTKVHVVNLDNGRDADVTINDRGPFVEGRILDLSRAAAEALGAVGPGVVPVRLEVRSLGDGMPDDWEVAHDVTDPNADPDGDGFTNQQEFTAGTNPLDPASVLKLELSPRPNDRTPPRMYWL